MAATIYAVGSGGKVYISSNGGTSWALDTTLATAALYGIWGVDATDIHAVGAGPTAFRKQAGSWDAGTTLWTGGGDSKSVHGIDANNVYAVGVKPANQLQWAKFNGSSWSNGLINGDGTNKYGHSIYAGDVTGTTPIVVADDNGRAYRAPTAMTPWTAFNTPDWWPQGNALHGVITGNGSAIGKSCMFTGDISGDIYRYYQPASATWVQAGSTITGFACYALWVFAYDNAYAVGGSGANVGTVYHWNGSTWSSVHTNSLGTSRLYGVWASATDDIHAIGEDGWYSHYNGASWSDTKIAPTITLQGIYGFAADITPPVLQNQSPASAATDVGVGASVTLEIVDVDSGVSAAATKLKINSVLAWSGDAAQTGFSVVKTTIVNGFKYVIDPIASFPVSSAITIGVYAEDTVGNVLDTSYIFTTKEELSVPGDVSASMLTQRLVRVHFPVNVVVDDALTTLSNYSVETLTVGSDNVSILAVNGISSVGAVSQLPITSYVDVNITLPTLTSTYKINVANLHDENGYKLVSKSASDPLNAEFIGRATKTDSMIATFPKLYNTKIGSNLFHILLALAVEDEKVGGQGDLSALPVKAVTDSLSTYGSATFGTSTFGG